MQSKNIKSIVIVGGGTAGWISASTLAKVFEKQDISIKVIESSAIPTIGVGEATIPPILDFIRFLGINEAEFIQKTNSTFKLGIKFDDWLDKGCSYFHQFGGVGLQIDGAPFYSYWLKMRSKFSTLPYSDFSPAGAMAKKGKFIPPTLTGKESILRGANYALHFDAALVAKVLKEYSCKKQVKHLDALVEQVQVNGEGYIDQLVLNNKETISADLFIDCTGFRGLLIEESLAAGYENWQKYLPCDRAVVVQSQASERPNPYTIATAHSAGWQWKIPLQTRMGNGYVYSSDYCSSSLAEETLLSNLETPIVNEPRTIHFVTGHRSEMWKKNCVAVGLSSGFLEPLESTSIHLIMRGVKKLIELFPNKENMEPLAKEYNQSLIKEFEAIRDFLMLHYIQSERMDSDFWRDMKSRPLPDSLANKIELFQSSGIVSANQYDLFSEVNWQAVFEGMGVEPEHYDPLIEQSSEHEVESIFKQYKTLLDTVVEKVPDHKDFLNDIPSSESMSEIRSRKTSFA